MQAPSELEIQQPEPPGKTVHAALRKTTELLAGELATPSATAPDWSEFEWRIARAVATMHGISPLLSHTLRWQGPPVWAQFLSEQRAHTARRYQRIQDLLALIHDRAQTSGIGCIGLKGAALHAMGLYVAGERPMADVDILAHQKDSKRVAKILESIGFRETCVTWKHQVFEPGEAASTAKFGEHADNAMKIELHTHIREILPRHTVDITDQIFAFQLEPGLNYYPSKAALMSHLLLHAAGAMMSRAFRMINLQDIARLAVLMTEQDWEHFLAQAGARGQKMWWAYPPLVLTARYCGSLPDRVVAAASVGCPRALRYTTWRRTLADASLSYLWISAFSGIEWSASARESLFYAWRRIVPNRELRAAREVLVNTEAFAAQNPWARLSQSRRILRWLTSRQMRGETLRPVRFALSGQ